jgi:hypothetical protein
LNFEARTKLGDGALVDAGFGVLEDIEKGVDSGSLKGVGCDRNADDAF